MDNLRRPRWEVSEVKEYRQREVFDLVPGAAEKMKAAAAAGEPAGGYNPDNDYDNDNWWPNSRYPTNPHLTRDSPSPVSCRNCAISSSLACGSATTGCPTKSQSIPAVSM